MKLNNKLLKDIKIRLNSSKFESSKRSLKLLIRLNLINYLSVLNISSKFRYNSSFNRKKNRCFITSRSLGNFSKISLSRIKFRELIHNGLLLGFTKASW